ncbi:unnamed protein product [Penicillium roqueforti FM164]|uniref:Uncharacterized protein n=1 Tax=Penicillium roqueforti (strain FM164) TaxID=1365484 RepID=W6QKE7_PENRF|nr:unnamed protein product [Penicillium roqueforti FM164]
MSQEEGFMQQWGCGPSEPNCSILTDPKDSSPNENLSGFQQFARSEGVSTDALEISFTTLFSSILSQNKS